MGWDGMGVHTYVHRPVLWIYLDREVGHITPRGDAVNYPLGRIVIVSMHKDRSEGLRMTHARRSAHAPHEMENVFILTWDIYRHYPHLLDVPKYVSSHQVDQVVGV